MRIDRVASPRSPSTCVVALLAAIAGCSSSGGGSHYSVSASPAAVSFTAVPGDPLPAAVRVQVSFVGDGLVVGYPPDVPVPPWLDVTGDLTGSGSAVLYLRPNTTALAVGTYATTLRLVTGKSDGSELVTSDVSVTYRVRTGLSAQPATLAFAAIEGAAPAQQDVTLSSDVPTETWTVAARLPGGGAATWVVLPQAAGALTGGSGHTGVGVATLPAGDYAATLEVRDGSQMLRASIPIAYHVDTVASAEGVAFTVDVSTDASGAARTTALRPRVATAAGAAYAWTAAPTVPWLAVTPASGDLGAEVPLTFRLLPDQLATLPNGHYAGAVVVTFASSGVTAVSVPVTLDLLLPTVDRVTPYASWVGQSGPVVLRGTAFGSGPTVTAQFGTQQVAARVVSDGEARVTAPPQEAPGVVSVGVVNGLGLTRGTGRLTVLASPAYASYRAEIPNVYAGIVLDPERQTVWMSGYNANGFLRIRFDQGAWTTSQLALPTGNTIALSADGQDLFTVGTGFYDPVTIQRRDPETLAIRATDTRSAMYEVYGAVASLADGRTMLVETDQWSSTRWYPGLTSGPSLDAWNPGVVLTRDRTLLIAVGANNSGAYTFEAGASAFRTRSVSGLDRAPSASADGGRLVTDRWVWDRDFNFLGAVDPGALGVTRIAVASDGKSAYVALHDAAWTTKSFGRIDLTPAAGPYTVTPLVLPVSIPDQESVLNFVVSEDGGTLFLVTYISSTYSTPERRFFYAIPLT